MKKILPLFLLIVTINAQEKDVLKSKYGFREFDDPIIDNNITEKTVTGITALFKSSIVNSNPEFISATSDSVYEDSTYLFNVLTNDPNADTVTVSVASNPSWLSITSKVGGRISTITKAYGLIGPDNNVKATESLNGLITDVAVDSDGNFYYSDRGYNVINKIDANGNLTIFAGTGESGYSGDGGAATSAKLYQPSGLAFDSNGNLFFADYINHVIRKIDSNGIISTYAGTGTEGLTGDGGAATSATLNNPYDIVFDSNGNLYIADQDNSRIRKVDTSGNISTFAGSAIGYDGDGGAATSAELDRPSGVAFDSNGNLYIADWGAYVVRKVDTNGNISTFAGTGVSGYSGDGGAATSAKLSYPWGIEVDPSGNIYIGDMGNYLIRKVNTNGNISTFAGTGVSGYSGDGGAATSATFRNPENTLWYNNNLYIPDSKALRKIDSSGNISTIAGGGDGKVYNGDNIAASTARIENPRNMWMDKNDNLYFAEQTADRIRKIDVNGIITTVAGTGVGGFSGDGGAATSAQIEDPRGVTGDNAGNLYISDRGNSRIRKVDSNGIISTVAGTGTNGYSGDGGDGTSAQIDFPYALTIYGGDLYFADLGNNVIRKLDVDGDGTISTVAGTGEGGYSGDGGAATSAKLDMPGGVNFDSQGNMYIADTYNSRIRKVDTNGNITTVAGTGTEGHSGDGGAATSANINVAINVIVDAADNLLIAQWGGDYAIRKVWKGSDIITTVAGTGTSGYTTDTTAIHALLKSPQGLALDSKGNLFFGSQGNDVIRKVDASYHKLTGTPTNSDVGSTTMTLTASDGQGGSATQSFVLKVINTNDAPVLTSVTNVTINEDTAKSITLSATDVDGDVLTYTGKSNTDKVTVAISSTTMTLTPAADWHGTASITAYVTDGTVKDSTSFTLTVASVSDVAAINTTTIEEDASATVTLSSTFSGTPTYSAKSDTSAITVSVSSSTLQLTPSSNWYGTSTITAYASIGTLKDSTTFTLMVTNVQDAPYAFDWVSTASDTIDISQSNLADTYELKWSESKDVDGDTIDYLLYVKIGVLEPEEIYDTTSTSVPITYQEFLENVFEPFPMLPRVTVQFSMEATDGIDTVKITGDNRVLFVNRYEYLSTVSEGIPTEFALHENYPNPFNPTTTLRFDLPELSDMTLTIYNMLGQKVRTFDYQNTSAGYHSVTWDATNDLGQQVGAGVYLYQLQAKDFVKTRKMVLLK